jgi:Fe-S cluster assembly protein SufD
MMQQEATERAEFEALLLEQCKKNVAQGGPLAAIRKKGLERFQEIGLPTKHSEVFQSIRFHSLFTPQYQFPQETVSTAIPTPAKDHATLIFVNGCYQPALSNTKMLPPSIVIAPLEKAINTYGLFLNHQWSKATKEEQDPFVVLNTALHRDGVFIYVPPKTILEGPIEIVHIVEPQDQSLMLTPRLHICVGAHSQISFSTTVKAQANSTYCLNQVCEITVEENAHVKFRQLAMDEGSHAWHFDAMRVTQKRNSTFTAVSMTNGCGMMRNDYRVALMGENAEASLNGVWRLKDKLEAHTNVLIDHQAPNCRSHQLFKGVLDDFSRSSFEGKILVQKEAQKTDAFQLNHNLLLSDRANADSKPNLEVFADDVKASHGATVGQLDQEQIFYLRTRGLPEQAAKQFLIEAFCNEVTAL